MPVSYFQSTFVLEGRLTAARAAALDELLAANLPTDVGAIPTVMRGTDGAALALLGRSLEAYTFTYGLGVADNDANLVTVLDVASGRGLLMSFGGAADDRIFLKLTVDGSILLNNVEITGAAGSASILGVIPFTTSCKVEMRLWAANNGRFWAVALVET